MRGSGRWIGRLPRVSQTPSPTPAPPTTPPPPQSAPARPTGLEDYQRVAETVGGLSLRWSDNLIQALVIIGSTLIGAGVGWLVGGGSLGFGASMGPRIGALLFGAGAMIASTLISGLILMILGWVRAARSRRR